MKKHKRQKLDYNLLYFVDDILAEILLFIGTVELLTTAKLVCKRFYSIVSGPRVLRHLNNKYMQGVNGFTIDLVKSAHKHFLLYETVDHIDYRDYYKIKHDQLGYIWPCDVHCYEELKKFIWYVIHQRCTPTFLRMNRRRGSSTMLSLAAITFALHAPQSNILMIFCGQRAKKIVSKTLKFIRHAVKYFAAMSVGIITDSTIQFINGSRIKLVCQRMLNICNPEIYTRIFVDECATSVESHESYYKWREKLVAIGMRSPRSEYITWRTEACPLIEGKRCPTHREFYVSIASKFGERKDYKSDSDSDSAIDHDLLYYINCTKSG